MSRSPGWGTRALVNLLLARCVVGAASHAGHACILLGFLRVLDTPGLLLQSKIISRRNCLKTPKTAIKPSDITHSHAQTSCHGVAASGQGTESPVSCTPQGLALHAVAHVPWAATKVTGGSGKQILRTPKVTHHLIN